MDIYILTKSLKGVILIKKSSLHHISIGHIYCQHRDARVLNFVQSQKIWTLYMANRFSLLRNLVQLIGQNQLYAQFQKQRFIYEILCQGYIWIFYVCSKRFAFGSIQKRHMCQSQVARITLFTVEFQFFLYISKNERYLILKGKDMPIGKLDRRDHFNSKYKC